MPDNRYYYFKDAKGNRHTVNKAAFDNDREGFAKAFPGARMEVIDRKTGRRGDVDVKDAGRVGDFGAHLFTGQTVRREKYQPKTSLGKAAQRVAQEKWGKEESGADPGYASLSLTKPFVKGGKGASVELTKPLAEGGKESALVKGLREADALKRRDEEQMPIDYTKPDAMKQMVGRTRREQQTLDRRIEQAGREAGKEVMKPLREKEARLKTPVVNTGDANVNAHVINTQEQAERQLAESGLEFANKHLDDYVSDNILNEFKTATAKGAAAESALSKASPFAYMAAGKAYNEALDPDKLLKHLQEKANADIAKVLSHPKMQEEIGLKAAAYGISPEEYVEKSLIPGLQAKLAADFDKSELSRSMPKSTAEYILRGVNESMLGTIMSMGMTSKKQRQYAQQGMAMTDAGENPNVNPGMAARVARGTLGFVADAPVFGAAGKAGAAVAGKVFGNGVAQTARIANSTIGGRIARMAGSGMVSQVITGVLYGSTNAAVQNYSTGDDTSIGNTVKVMAMGGLSEGASWATMGGIGGVVGAGIYNVSGVKRIPAKAFQLAMEGIGMHMGGNVAKTIEGHDTDWLSVEGNLEACANVVALKLTHARLPKRQSKDGVKESYLDMVARNINGLMTSDGQRAAFGGYTFTNEEKEQLFGSASAPKRNESIYGYDVHDNPLTRKESLTSWAMRAKKTAAKGKGEESYKDTDAEFVKTAYDEIMADNTIPWDTKAKFSALVMGTVPSARPMMENCRIEGNSVNEYSKNGELLSKNSFKNIDERNSIIYSLNMKREDQRLSNAYGAAQIKDEKTAQATLEAVAEANGMTAEQLKAAMDKQPLRRSDEEQNACVALRKAYEDEQFVPGTLHAEQSNTEGKDVVEENNLGTENPNNEAVAKVLGDLTKAEDALQAAMDGNDVLKEEYERMQKAGMSNPQIYMELFNSGLTQEQLAPLADYINALSKAQGMFKGTQDKIVETTQKHVGQWSYKGELNGEKQNGEQMVFVKDNKGRVLIVGAGDVAFDGEGRVRDGDMLTVYDPVTREMDFVHAKDVTLERTTSSEEYAKDYQRQLEELNSEVYAAMQQDSKPNEASLSQTKPGEQPVGEEGNEASLSLAEPTEPVGEKETTPVGEEPVATLADGTPVPMMKDSKGRETADYSQMSPEQGAEWMSSQFGENAEAAVDGQIKRAEKTLKDAEKIKVDYTGDLNDAKEAEAQKTMAVDAAKKELELYTNIKKAMTEKKVKAGMEKVSSVGGVGEVGSVGVAREKFESGLRVVGNKRTRTLADGSKLRGHYEIVDADSLTPSHNANDGYKKSEGFPVNEEGMTINDRDYENDKQAQLVTDMIAMKYDGQAVDQVPVVTSDGIVVDGNGRTMAGQKAAKNGTDSAYLEALKENAENYGFTAEQIEQSGIKHPRLVLVSDEPMKYDTATFAKFNKNEKKAQDNTQQAVANTKKLSTDETGTIISEIEGSGSLDAFFNNPSAINSLLTRLVDKGVIGLNEVAGLREGEDKLSAAGKDFVKNLLLGSVFSENTIRMMGADAMLKTKALNGIRAVTDNMKLGDYALMKEIDNAVQLLYEARQGGSGVDAYLRTPAMFGENAADRYDPISQAIALALEGKVEDFRELMMAYNRNAAPYADASQTEMFGERPTKEDFVNEFLKLRNWEDYETRHSSKEGNGDAGSSEGTEPQARGGNEPTEGEGLAKSGNKTLERKNIDDVSTEENGGPLEGDKEGKPGNDNGGSPDRDVQARKGQREVDKAVKRIATEITKKTGIEVVTDEKEAEEVIRESEETDSDLKYHKETDEATLEELENGETVKVYRAMQVIDGKLYPPMAAVVNGKRVEANELGVWIRADENPDLAIPDIDPKTKEQKVDKKTGELKWKFKLDKGGKDATGKKATDIPAAYNPYWHTSRSPLNDQFKSAWIRPNIVVVECEVPVSELSSGYRAERAKDAVGEVDWKSGVVSGEVYKQTGRARKVILSRWCKPVRVLSDAEVAQRAKEFVGEAKVEIPENVLTPKQRIEFEKVGFKIGAPEKGVKKSDQINEALKRGLQIDNSVKEFRTAKGEVYGFTDGEKIYLDTRKMKPETPLHEYTHLWCDMLRHVNSKEWENVKKLFDEVEGLKDEVQKLYPELEGDALYEEMITTYSGREGTKKLEDVVRKLAAEDGKSVTESAKAQGFLEKVKEALTKYWKGVADVLGIHFTTAEEVADKVLADWAKGVDPRGSEEGKEKREESESKVEGNEPSEASLGLPKPGEQPGEKSEGAKPVGDGKEPKANPLDGMRKAAELFNDEQITKARAELAEAKKSGDASEVKRLTDKLKGLMDSTLRGKGIGLVERRKIIGEELGKEEAEKIDKPWADMEFDEQVAETEKKPLDADEIKNSDCDGVDKANAVAYLNGDKNIINTLSYLTVYDNVRNRERDSVPSSGTEDGTQLDAADNAGGEGLGRTDSRPQGVDSGQLGGSEGDGNPERGESVQSGERVSGGESGKVHAATAVGERGGEQVHGGASRVEPVSTGGTKPRGSRGVRGTGRDVRERGNEGSGNFSDEKAGEATGGRGIDSRNLSTVEQIDKEISDTQSLVDDLFNSLFDGRTKGSIISDRTNASIIPLASDHLLGKLGINKQKMAVYKQLIPALTKLGYLHIKKGVVKLNDWIDAMKGSFGGHLTKLGLSDEEVYDYIKNMWNSNIEVDGVTHKLSEWASILGTERMKKEIATPNAEKYKRQVDAEPIKVKIGDKKNIEETLPYLLPQQQEDVLRAETQFFGKEHADREHAYGKGYMFTNGTGTGKTFTGLGVAKRLVKQGKGRILIVTPSQKKVSDWIKDGRNLNMEIRDLDNWAKERGTTATTESGEGVVITTFANFGVNKKLLETKWDAVIYDESHRIMENKNGTETARSMQHYMVTNRSENHCFLRLQETNKDYQKMKSLGERFDAERGKEVKRIQDEYKASHPSATPRDVAYATSRMLPKEINGFTPGDYASFPKLGKIHAEFVKALSHYTNEVEPKLKAQAKNEWKDTKTIFLSATPFNTRENLDYAEGYIFKYPEVEKGGRISGRTQFYLDHFGAAYKFRYNRLEQSTSNPEAVAKQEIEFSDYLQHTLGTMSGRIIDSPYDYSRDFPTVSPDHAEEFNQAVQDAVRGHGVLADAYRRTIGDYNYGSALFETMKVANIIERIKAHLDAGRKVVIFHRRVETKEPLKPPFAYLLEQANFSIALMKPGEEQKKAIQAVKDFRKKYADLLKWEQTLDYSMPREQIAKVFGKDKVLFFSGKESTKVKDKAVDTFNSDDSGKNIIVIQEASGKEGISLHDTTGKHQRVCITLALPQSPITALQIEGRTYRIGNKSNAIFEYPILGLNSEMMLFGQKFNNQVSTTENLALGSQARSLRDSFANGILEHSGVVPIDQQGVGGKEFDAPKDQSTDGFDNAVLDYYSNQKLNSRNREGVDYFPTPEPLGYKMMEWANMGEGDTVLEPSAGHGAIARYAPKGNQMVAIEPSQSLFTKLQLKAGGLGRKFQNTIFENYDISNKHDVVVMNPPFGTAGATAIAHLGKAFKHLEEGGRVVALIPRGSTDKKFDKWIEGEKTAVMRAEVELPDIVFKQAGTNVVCRVVVVDKISNKAMRAKAGSVEKWDLGGHYDKIEDFFEDLRDVEMPDRIIDTNAIMMKKSKQTVKDLKELKNVTVDFNEGGINVRVRGDWKDYSIPFDMEGYSAEQKKKFLASTYETFEQQERQTRNETSQAVLAELKKLTCKLAGMTEEEMQRYLKKKYEGKGVMYRIEHAAEVYNKAKGGSEGYASLGLSEPLNERISKAIDKAVEQTGGKVKMVNSVEEIGNEQVRRDIENGKQVTGWYDENTGEVHLYMPNIHDSYTAEKTVWHETVGHKGMRGLLGDKFNDYMRGLWMDLDNPVNAELRAYVKERMDKDSMGFYDAIEEFIAESAEKGKGEPGFWNYIKNKVTDALHEIGYRISPNVKDVKYMLWLAKNVQKKGDDPWWKMRADAVKWKIEHENVSSIIEENGMMYDNNGKKHGLLDLNKKDFDEATDGRVHYRTSPMTASKIEEYNRRLSTKWYAFKESTVDDMQSLQEAMQIISGVKDAYTDIPSAFNPLLCHNRMGSMVMQMCERYDREYTEPLGDAFKKVVSAMPGKDGAEQTRNANLYFIKKHGLERNRVLFVRDRFRKMEKTEGADSEGLDNLDKIWKGERSDLRRKLDSGQIDLREYYRQMDEWIVQNIDKDFKAEEHDYSGMHGIYDVKKGEEYDDVNVIDEVMSTESQLGAELVKSFWDAKKKATDFTIDQEYANGFKDKNERDHLKEMFDWYVPLRKFDETVAEDVYGYISGGDTKNEIGSVIEKASGRESLSDVNVLAQISALAKSSIINGGKNVEKQHFMRFVEVYEKGDAKDRIFVEIKPWVEKHTVDGNEVWEEVMPNIPENSTQEQINEILNTFETTMKAKQAKGEAKIARRKSDIGYKFERSSDMNQHIVNVYVNGRVRRFVCQGNPRAAQAINGLLRDSGTRNWATEKSAKLNRICAQLNTSLNPDFISSNLMRDLTFASANLTKEGMGYTLDFCMEYAKNWGSMVRRKDGNFDGGYLGMFRRYKEGRLDTNNQKERWFKEFMDNGGETGFVSLKKYEDIIKEYENLVKTGNKDGDRWLMKKLKEGGALVELANEVVENVARYSTYCVSRKRGRSIGKSIYDAKEVSSNFNRHGSGDAVKSLKTEYDGKTNTAFRKSVGWFNSYMKNQTMFYNAGVQGANLFAKNIKHAPKTAAIAFGAMPFGLNIAVALLNQLLISQEDEKKRNGVKNPYAELPEWKRRNNLCIYWGGGKFKTIPMGIELRAFYGLGDIAAGYMVDESLKSDTPIGFDVIGQMAQLVPASDFLGHHSPSSGIKESLEDVALSLTPTVAKPELELAFNRNWTGRPIYRDKDYLDRAPRWKSAYDNTNDVYMTINKWANKTFNGIDDTNEDLKGSGMMADAADFFTAPYGLQHIVEGYTGGTGATIGRIYHTGKSLVNGVVSGIKDDKGFKEGFKKEWKNVDPNSIPFYRVFNYTPKEGNDMQRTKSKWYNYVNELEQLKYNKRQMKTNTSDVVMNIHNAATKYKLSKTKEGKMLRIYKAADKYITAKNKLLKRAKDQTVINSINEDINRKMQEAVADLDRISDD